MKSIDERRVPGDIMTVYNELTRGAGREAVSESNVGTLIRLAERDGHAVLRQELREWKADISLSANQGLSNKGLSSPVSNARFNLRSGQDTL